MKEGKEIINNGSVEQQSLIKDLRQIIDQARGHVAATARFDNFPSDDNELKEDGR